MLFRILLIYVVVLIIIEILFIINSKSENKIIRVSNIDKLNTCDIKQNNLVQIYSNKDIEIKEYTGKFYLNSDNYGVFINVDQWNLLEINKLYNFTIPVNIKILIVNDKDPIEYYIENEKKS